MAEECSEFERDRNKKLTELKAREENELRVFDEHSCRLGFTLLSLTNTPPSSLLQHYQQQSVYDSMNASQSSHHRFGMICYNMLK